MRYRCPTTNDEITTAIETGRDVLSRMTARNLKIWVWCPHCVSGHQIRAADALLREDEMPLQRILQRPDRPAALPTR
jgi:hypothetical protein